ncbi:glutamate--cysteine ligase [Orobanche hederae]
MQPWLQLHVVPLYDEVSLQNISDVTADWTMKQRQMLRNKLWLGGFSRYLGEVCGGALGSLGRPEDG